MTTIMGKGQYCCICFTDISQEGKAWKCSTCGTLWDMCLTCGKVEGCLEHITQLELGKGPTK